jgi:hypothetical protein
MFSRIGMMAFVPISDASNWIKKVDSLLDNLSDVEDLKSFATTQRLRPPV